MTSGISSGGMKQAALVLWSSGMAAAMFDLLALPLLGVQAPVSYVFFGTAAMLVFLAEVKQHTFRFALYRAHDLLMYSPWKYLTLYFLWISLFAAFTVDPVRSLLYAATGWFSLLAVGLGGTLLFHESGLSGSALVVSRLQLPFFAWAAGLLVLQGGHLLHVLFPAFPVLHDDPVSFHLYFLMGMPFLLWDFLHRSRRLLPRWISGAVLVTGAATLLLSDRRFFQASMAVGVASYLAVALYKRARLRSLPALALVALAAGATFWAMKWVPVVSEKRVFEELMLMSRYYEERLSSQIRVTAMILQESRWLGTGLGLADLRGVWARVPAEAGVPGVLLYFLFFMSLLKNLHFVRRSPRIVVSNVAFVSAALFLGVLSFQVENPYGAYVWAWYALWTAFALTSSKREAV